LPSGRQDITLNKIYVPALVLINGHSFWLNRKNIDAAASQPRTLACSWQQTDGFPPGVRTALIDYLADIQLLLAP